MAGLEKKVTYSETKIPLGELVQKVAADTGVALTAARDIADEPVAVVVQQVPARELLGQLADLLDYRWSRRTRVGGPGLGVGRDEPGPRSRPANALMPNAQGQTLNLPNSKPHPPAPAFELYQDIASKQREEALRRSVARDVEAQLRRAVRRYAEMAALPPSRIQAILEAEQHHQEDLGRLPLEERQRRMRAPEERERKRWHDTAQRLPSPVARALTLLLGRLTPRQWEMLHAEGQLFLSTDPEYGELPLPDQIARRLRDARPTLYPPSLRVTFNDAAQEERLHKREREGQELWAAGTGYRVKVRLDARAFRTRGMLVLMSDAVPLRGGAPDHAQRFEATGLTTTTLFLHAAPEDSSEHARDDAPPRDGWENDPVLGIANRFQPAAKPRPRPSESGHFRIRLRDLLPDMARAYGAQFLMDAYWAAPGLAPSQLLGAEPITLATLLDRLAGPSHRWERRGELVRLRSRTWYFDRPREVPLRLVRHWERLHAERAALPLEAYVEMATTLTDEQLNSLPDVAYEYGLPPDVHRVYSCRYALRLYAALTPGQQRALWQGRPLAVARMTPAQRALFLAAVRDPNRHRSKPMNLSRWTEGSLSLTSRRVARVQPGNGRTFTVPVDAAGRADPVVWQQMREVSGGALGAEPGTGMSRPLTGLRLRFEYDPERPQDFRISIASP